MPQSNPLLTPKKKLTARQKKVLPLIDAAYVIINQRADKFVNEHKLDPNCLRLIGRDESQGWDLPVKIQILYKMDDCLVREF